MWMDYKDEIKRNRMYHGIHVRAMGSNYRRTTSECQLCVKQCVTKRVQEQVTQEHKPARIGQTHPKVRQSETISTSI